MKRFIELHEKPSDKPGGVKERSKRRVSIAVDQIQMVADKVTERKGPIDLSKLNEEPERYTLVLVNMVPAPIAVLELYEEAMELLSAAGVDTSRTSPITQPGPVV